MNVLITGGAGFIGSHLADRRLARGDRVVVLDNFDDFYDQRLKRGNVAANLGNSRYRLVEGDIRDRDLVGGLFAAERFDAVLHLAARAGLRESLSRAALYEEVNCLGTIHLLEAAAAHGKPRFLFASSSSVYGAGERLPFSEDLPADRPISPYAATKRAAELHVWAAHHIHGLPAACLRFFTVYGPRQRPQMAISRFVEAIDSGEPIPFYGDGSSLRDYTYVDDLADGVESALEASFPFEILNLGRGQPVALSQLVREIEQALGKTAVLDRRPAHPGDVPAAFASVEKAQKLLHFRARVTLEEGLRRCVEWHRRGK